MKMTECSSESGQLPLYLCVGFYPLLLILAFFCPLNPKASSFLVSVFSGHDPFNTCYLLTFYWVLNPALYASHHLILTAALWDEWYYYSHIGDGELRQCQWTVSWSKRRSQVPTPGLGTVSMPLTTTVLSLLGFFFQASASQTRARLRWRTCKPIPKVHNSVV